MICYPYTGYLHSPLLNTCTVISQICNSSFEENVDHLERFQRLATRMIKNREGLPYEERLEKLNVHSLARRRLISDLILVYDLNIGSLDIPLEEYCTRPPCSFLRGHYLKLYFKRFR